MSDFLSYEITAVTQSVYIHWPFCPYKCHFCPFVAFSGYDHYMPMYHEALLREIDNFDKKKMPFWNEDYYRFTRYGLIYLFRNFQVIDIKPDTYFFGTIFQQPRSLY